MSFNNHIDLTKKRYTMEMLYFSSKKLIDLYKTDEIFYNSRNVIHLISKCSHANKILKLSEGITALRLELTLLGK